MTPISERQREHLYTKSKTKCETFLYTKSLLLCKNQDNIRYVFIYKKHNTLLYTISHEILKLAFLYKKHDTLRCVTFYIQKARHFAKSKTICLTFLYTKILTLFLRNISLNFFEIGIHFYNQKQWTLRYILF